MHALELLTNKQMLEADRLSVAAGVASLKLMQAAGRVVAEAVQTLTAAPARIVVLCGPGNNGGDGFVAARVLQDAGYEVLLALLAERQTLRGDAAEMAQRYTGAITQLTTDVVDNCDVIVDALFGAGLSRPLTGLAAEGVAAANATGKRIVAVDVPSGLDGDSGAANGPVINASHTVTFFRLKPGHVLMPGRMLCGQITVADIGTLEQVLTEIQPAVALNAPSLWLNRMPWPRLDGHKYHRGHAVIVSGPCPATGAARLAARAALRVGTGLVTLASPIDAVATNAAHLTAVMIESFATLAGLREILSDQRKTAVLIGPGRGVFPETKTEVLTVLESGAATVLDADALTVFAGDAGHLATLVMAKPDRPVVITPHSGEFDRLFPDLKGSKLQRAREAALQLGVVVVLKGADTVIAEPNGRAVINDNAPADLATAGSGDVLAGLVTGLLAQQMPAFEAACAAVWCHGAAAQAFGPGLIAEDLPEQLPSILKRLKTSSSTET